MDDKIIIKEYFKNSNKHLLDEELSISESLFSVNSPIIFRGIYTRKMLPKYSDSEKILELNDGKITIYD